MHRAVSIPKHAHGHSHADTEPTDRGDHVTKARPSHSKEGTVSDGTALSPPWVTRIVAESARPLLPSRPLPVPETCFSGHVWWKVTEETHEPRK